MNKTVKSILKLIPIMLIAGVGFFAFQKISFRPKPKQKERNSQKTAVFVQVQKAQYKKNRLHKKIWARVKPLKSVQLRSEINARILEKSPLLRPGLKVKKNQILAYLDKERLTARKEQIKAREKVLLLNQKRLKQEIKNTQSELSLAQNSLLIAQKNTARFKQLIKNNSASKVQLSTYEQTEIIRRQEILRSQNRLNLIPIEIQRLEAEKVKIKAELKSINRDLKDSLIKAPFAGILQNPIRQKGDWLRAGDILCGLQSQREIELWATLGLSDLTVFDQGPYQANIPGSQQNIWFSRKLGQADERLQTDTLIFRKNNNTLSLNALIPLNISKEIPQKTICLPQKALITTQLKPAVYIVKKGTLAKRAISILKRFNGKIYINEGLYENDEVVINHLENIEEGQAVKKEIFDEKIH